MRERTAVLLFTLPSEVEEVRKDWCASRTGKILLDRVLERLAAGVESLPGFDLILSAPCSSIAGRPVQHRQSGLDFGTELRRGVRATFAQGYSRVLVIGNDAPDLSPAYLAQAARQLDRTGRRAVIGTAHDGGYVLLGLNAWCPAAFNAIDWGTQQVAAQTRTRLRSAGFHCTQLAPLSDLDTAADIARWFDNGLFSGVRAELAARLASPIASVRSYCPARVEPLAESHLVRGPPCLESVAA